MFPERSRAPTNQLLYNLLSFSRVGMRAGAARASESARVAVRARDDVRARRSRATAATTTTRAAKSSDGEMDEQRYDAVVVGAGIIGLACARELSSRGMKVVLIDKENVVGAETSSRNSEVLHAGMHYAPGSKKASYCVKGRRMIEKYCQKKNVTWDNIGKFIVAQAEDQMDELEAMIARAEMNGVDDLELVSKETLVEQEKNVRAVAGVWSPSTSIVDSKGLMESFKRDCERDGRTKVILGDEVMEISRGSRKTFRVKTKSNLAISAPRLVNAAGLYAHKLTERMFDVYDTVATPTPPSYFARGMYCGLKKGVPTPFKRLVYPLPRGGGLGVHFTRDVNGVCKFGPDIEWIDDIDYTMKVERVRSFYEAIREYWPGLQDGMLRPAYTGIRPKLINRGGDTDESGATTDFVIQTECEHGAPGLVQLFGFESPGLTSCMALAESVNEFLE